MFNDKHPDYWKEISSHDIETINILIKENGPVDIIIYHMHQAIEKLLKGLILKEKDIFPFIHDLERLYKILLNKNKNYEGIDEDIIILNSYYKDLRYPQSDFLDDNDCLQAKQSFEKIYLKLKY